MPTLASLTPLAVVVAVLCGTLAGWLAARRQPDSRAMVFPAVIDCLGIGLLCARLGYILQWWPQYIAEPWSMLRIGDGGFELWVGLPCALAFAAWRLWRRPQQRQVLATALLAAAAGWLVSLPLLRQLEAAPPQLPALALMDLQGRPLPLQDVADRPLVLNLWATWCPPCRREMPALLEAQREHPELRIVLLNQGESAADVRRYLATLGPIEAQVLLDPTASATAALEVRGYPVTLFYAPGGELLDRHAGELTRGGLAGRLARLGMTQ